MLRHILVAILVLELATAAFLTGGQIEATITSADCTYLDDPADFHYSPDQHWQDVTERAELVSGALRPIANRYQMNAADAPPMPRKNFIDEYIFGRMERAAITPAPLANDQEFLRRVFLDLTGRIPTAEQVEAFAYDTNPAKRDVIVDALVGNIDYINKWTMFFGDLYKNNGNATNVNRYQQGRDAFYIYLKDSVSRNKPYNEMAAELITATGDSFVNGATNWLIGGTVPMGPAQDTYDGQAVHLSQMFLGINTVDCLLCHDGARHLDTVNLWGKQQRRADLQGLSAFFARTRRTTEVVSQTPLYVKSLISELTTGEYLLNTTTGNRSSRTALNGVNRVDPRYPFNGARVAANANRRTALADLVTNDPQFARAIVNYVWEKLMVVPFVSPSNAFDPARLDPKNPPPEPWTLQPTNPELLEALSEWFRSNNYDLRALMNLIAKSNAYQLSSSYPGEWKPEYVPFYARRFARRLDAEEIHDAVVQAAGVPVTYNLNYEGQLYTLPPAATAMELPDTREPLRANNGAAAFMNAFGRGDRDQTTRDYSGSPMQALNMMNNGFVMSRIHANNNGSTVQRLLREHSHPLAIVELLYTTTLNRYPTPAEITVAADVMRRLGNQRGAESLQWALLNKIEFLFSY